MPTPEETTRRLGAALRLKGMTQTELGRLLKADGLGATDPEQIMQGRKTMQRIHAEAFARHLEVGQRKRVSVSVDATGEQIDAHQAADSKCSARTSIEGTFGEAE